VKNVKAIVFSYEELNNIVKTTEPWFRTHLVHHVKVNITPCRFGSWKEMIGWLLDRLMDFCEFLFFKWRVFVRKRIIRKLIAIDATCQHCGRKVHDFIVPDEDWIRVVGHTGGILCYDCFCELCKDEGVFPVWVLQQYKEKFPEIRQNGKSVRPAGRYNQH